MYLENETLVISPSFDTVRQNETSEFFTTVEVSDGSLIVNSTTHVLVTTTNRKPEMTTASPEAKFIVKRGQVLSFSINATDPDGDTLSYRWKSGFLQNREGTATHTRRFLRSGVRTLSVEVSDGKESTSYEWKVLVK